MSVLLTHHAYGKSQIRLARVTRAGEHHDLKELSISVQLEGDFTASYTAGDNVRIVTTDTMKNTVYILAKKQGIGTIERFGQVLASHFLATYEQVSSATVELAEHSWQRIVANGQEHPHAFSAGSNERRQCFVTLTREGVSVVVSGISDLSLLKTTDSAFAGFVRDEYTTLPETNDRILATRLLARWSWAMAPSDWNAAHATARRALVETFAGHQSLSVQQTLHAMAEAVLAACPEISEITLTMPNKHYLPVNLQPFGLDNANEVFVPTDEPFGLITATLSPSAQLSGGKRPA